MSLFEQVARYTKLVLFGKRALWVLAVTLTLGVITTAWINSEDTGSRLIFSAIKAGAIAAPEPADMLRPHYQGIDRKNRPFTITADRATQLDAETVEMENVSADMAMGETGWTALTANHGLYHMKTKQLVLTDHVNLFYEGGYEFRSDRAEIQVEEGTASGDLPVEGQGPAGQLKADRFKVLDHGAILRFNGNVWVKLFV